MGREADELRRLVAQSRVGNTEAFHELYELLVARIFAYIRSRVTRHEQAVDLTQDVFVDLWKALPRFSFRSREQFYAFVFVITKRKLSEFYANRYKETVQLDDETNEDTHAEVPGSEEHDAVTRALATLDEETREIITLRHWSRYSFGEIAAMLDMTETAVRVRHHRALKVLKNYIDSP